ncbi:dihydroorotase [Cyclobacterium lianum]|uniref:Dihydroorotase n=1 Tax=Cyclobacterium lianum TaxID=388280 RepID=A0A1M7Q1P3_9BACT|nr:amidohydrolase/deacetylase family metallohydrolase [Cyclobacterium lianum]SHN24122.1 dihydroorotase [Cyclobacterium lianum]
MYLTSLPPYPNLKVLLLWMTFLVIVHAPAQEIDLLLKGGRVLDPKNEIDAIADIAISGKLILKIEKEIPSTDAKKTIDLSGYIVTPGLLDMHVHVFHGTDTESYIANGLTSLPPDGFTFRSGVTTVVDAGSSGWRNFREFKKQTIDKSQTRILALLNIVGTGMYGRFEEQNVMDMNPTMTSHMISRLFPEILVGIKSAHYWGDFTQVDLAVEAGNLANVPVMVDFGEHQPPNSIEALFMQHLRPGDIFTHTFSYGPNNRETIVDENLKVKPFVFQAQQRGIRFDVGHGGGAFSFRQAIPAIQQGFLPDVISSDLHKDSMNGGFKDMANLLSKFMNMGLSLQDVILRATWNPAQVIRREDLGHLDPGSEADIAVFSLREGDFGFQDIRRTRISGDKKLETEMTIRAGRIVWDLNGLSAPHWESELGENIK